MPLFERARLDLAQGEAEIREILDPRKRARSMPGRRTVGALETFESKLKLSGRRAV